MPEDKYTAFSEFFKGVIWIRNFIEIEMAQPCSTSVMSRCDNKVAAYWANYRMSMRRAKHVDFRYHDIQDCEEKYFAHTQYVPLS